MKRYEREDKKVMWITYGDNEQMIVISNGKNRRTSFTFGQLKAVLGAKNDDEIEKKYGFRPV